VKIRTKPHKNAQKPGLQHTYVMHAAQKVHFKLNMAFRIIQSHPYWCWQTSRTGCRRDAQSFLKLTKM